VATIGLDVHGLSKTQWWSPGSVYPHSKDCSSSQQMQPRIYSYNVRIM